MNTPYTYLIVHAITGMKYYGVRYSKNCHPNDLWNTYFTSSKLVNQLREQYGDDSFKIEIRKTFDTNDAAREWEHKVLRRLNAMKREDFLNMTNGKSIPPRYGPHSAETISKMSKPRNVKFKSLSQERKDAISKALIGIPRSDDVKNAISKGLKNKFKTEEHKQHISESNVGYVGAFCLTTHTMVRITKEEFDKFKGILYVGGSSKIARSYT